MTQCDRQVRARRSRLPFERPFANSQGADVRIASIVPNPAGERAEIRFQVPREERVRISLHDVNERLISILGDGSYSAGESRVLFLQHPGEGRLPRGTYFIQVKAGDSQAGARLLIEGRGRA